MTTPPTPKPLTEKELNTGIEIYEEMLTERFSGAINQPWMEANVSPLINELKRPRAGPMQSREKKLREALALAKYKFNEIQCLLDSLTDHGMEDAEKAMQEADLMPDGPSDEDRERLKRIFDHMVRKSTTNNGHWLSAQDFDFMYTKLKKYMEIDQESEKKTDAAGTNQT